MWSTLTMLLVVVLAGWAVAMVLRAPRGGPDPQVEWEHWLEASGLRPVLPRTRQVVQLIEALDRGPTEVDRAAMGRAGDGVPLVVARLVDGATLIAARRQGPVPTDAASTVVHDWQVTLTKRPLAAAWDEATWLRNGPAVAR